MTRPISSADFAEQVQGRLDGFLAGQADELSELGEQLTPMLSVAADAVRGGKRLRPTFCYWGWRAAGGDPDDGRILTAAAALELLHASALVHDDVIDDSDTRRGMPAAHRAFGAMHVEQRWPGRESQFGLGAAILLGDLLLAWSDQMLRSSGLVTDAALPYFNLMRNEVVAGQFLDLVAQNNGAMSVPQAMRVLRYKSAKYTIERPLHLGAALAGADQTLINGLTSYGLPLGEAFQLRDDLLGVYGDPAVTGKPAGDDLREGKRTMLVALAAEHADPEQEEVLHKHFGRAGLDDDGVAALRAVLDDTGARDRVEKLIDQLAAAAAAALEQAPVDPEVRTALDDLAGAVIRRDA
ncbi:MAG TPA: polyprenyl synthetase family protein [Nocardioidaceae bacterium]|nr:polyprenyl synthetase family protein [Nocardioidaceae bacterium]